MDTINEAPNTFDVTSKFRSPYSLTMCTLPLVPMGDNRVFPKL